MRKVGAAVSGETLKLRSHGSYGSLCPRPIALGLAHRLLSLVQLLFGAGELVTLRRPAVRESGRNLGVDKASDARLPEPRLIPAL